MIRAKWAIAPLTCLALAITGSAAPVAAQQAPSPEKKAEKEVERHVRVIRLGGRIVELCCVGLNDSDSTLVMRLPQDRLIFLVDLVPVGSFPGLGMIDFHPLEAIESLKKIAAMDWERMIPGHPGQPGDRLGTKKDVEDQIALQQYASEVVKEQARAGRCWNPAEANPPPGKPAG